MNSASSESAVFSSEEYELRLRTQRVVALMLATWGITMSGVYVSIGAPAVLPIAIAAISVLGGLIALGIRRIGLVLTSKLHTAMLGLALFFVMFFYGGVANHMSAWLVVLPVIALFQGSRGFARILFVGVVLSVVFVLGVEEFWGLPEPVLQTVAMRRVSAFSAIVSTSLVLVMGLGADWGIRRRNEALTQANDRLASEIEEHWQTQSALQTAQAEVVDAARLAGRAEVATGALHNIGNALNSVTVSTTRTLELVQQQRVARLDDLARMLDEHEDERYAAYIREVQAGFERARLRIVEELEHAQRGVQHVVRVVDLQQEVARHGGLSESVDLADSVRAAALLVGLPPRLGLTVTGLVDLVIVDRHRLLQILGNLLKNAREAEAQNIAVALARDGDEVSVSVTDDGRGLEPEHLTAIFAHGFTTKPTGSGFGLHASALAARELGGSLDVTSDGLGHGATFTLRFPVGRAGADQHTPDRLPTGQRAGPTPGSSDG